MKRGRQLRGLSALLAARLTVNMKVAPITLFAYARPDHTARTLEALAANELASDSVLYAFCDGPKKEEHRPKIEETRKLLDGINGFKDVVITKSDVNRGLSNSIVYGIGHVLSKHDRTVVVEDDLVSLPYFLPFMNEGLERYQSEPRVFAIGGYAPPMQNIPKDYPFDAFFSYRPMAWGWATWPDRWARFDFQVSDYETFKKDRAAIRRFSLGGADCMRLLEDQMEGRSNTWDIQWHYTVFKNDGLALLPVHSLIENIGTDATGTHFTGSTDRFDVDLTLGKRIEKWPDRVYVDDRMAAAFRKCYARTFSRGVNKAVRIVKGALGAKST